MQRAVSADASGGPPRDLELGQGWKLGQEDRQPSLGNLAGKNRASCHKLALCFKSLSLEGGSDLTVATKAIWADGSKSLTYTLTTYVRS